MLKKIVLFGAAIDSVSGYHDAGSTLEVSDEAGPGFISADRAQELVDQGSAVSETRAKELEAAGQPAADPIDPAPTDADAAAPAADADPAPQGKRGR